MCISKILKTALFITFLLSSVGVYGQQRSSDGAFLSMEKRLSKNLDDLLNQWYLGRMTFDTNISELNIYGFAKNEVPDYSDSVYIKRLKDLQSPIPLPFNSYVRNYIKVYSVRKRAQVENMLGLAYYYFPIFEEELARHNLPLELKYIPVIESALNTHAVSRSGATGLWQFMYPTARLYKLQITSNIDERRDPYKITEAGVLYFKDMYEVYRDWLLVIAAFNCGPGNVNKAIEASGYKSNFWEVYPYLPEQTRGYVPAFIAANYIMNYYVEHNLYPKNIYNPGLLDTVHVDRRLHFEVLGKALQMPIEQIKELNPQYIRNLIPKSTAGHVYILRLPVSKAVVFNKHRNLIYKYQDHVKMNEDLGSINGYQRIENRNKFMSTYTYDFEPLSYFVKAGDNLGKIADWYECTVEDIKRWNRVSGTHLPVGKRIVIYVPSTYLDKYKLIDAMTFGEKQRMIGKATDNRKGQIVEYVVGDGENLSTIVERFPGITVEKMMEWNKISLEDNLVPGYVLKIYLN